MKKSVPSSMRKEIENIPKPSKQASKIIMTYCEGLDASLDGRGWDWTHQQAYNQIVRALNSHDALLDEHNRSECYCSDNPKGVCEWCIAEETLKPKARP